MIHVMPVVVPGYECRVAGGHIYALIKKDPRHYVLYIRIPTRPADESDITYDRGQVTHIETNGGVGKQAEIMKIFRHMIGQSMQRDTANERLRTCRFHYRYNLSP